MTTPGVVDASPLIDPEAAASTLGRFAPMTKPDPVPPKPVIQPGQAGLPTLPGNQATIVTDLKAGQVPPSPTAVTKRPASENSAMTIAERGPQPLGDDL